MWCILEYLAFFPNTIPYMFTFSLLIGSSHNLTLHHTVHNAAMN